MNFNILYVEDDAEFAEDIEKAALHSREKQSISRPLHVDWIRSPDEIAAVLEQSAYDVILADVYFGVPKQNRLREIIDAVAAWAKGRDIERPIPIIAYTSEGQAALDECLALKDFLYDIWDKHTARPPYVAWRLNQLALEFARNRPDALLQRSIRNMSRDINGSGLPLVSWHEHVVDMTYRYDAGWTERDQVVRAGAAIYNIASALGTFSTCDRCWKIMIEWEALSRAASRRTRGHARHVINVFWLGYSVIHHPSLRDWFTKAWSDLIKKRANMEDVADVPPLEAMSAAWFYASLFHDIGGCVEKQTDVITSLNKILLKFSGIVEPQRYVLIRDDESVSDVPTLVKNFTSKADALLYGLGDSLSKVVKPLWEESLVQKHPDHGVLAAVFLTDALKADRQQYPFAMEAARAMMLHNIIGVVAEDEAKGLSWTAEPLSCLLILCDQLQTWDRERGDTTLAERDEPERAELSKFEVSMVAERPIISLSVHYLAPRHLDHAADSFKGVADTLDYILKDKPHRALARIQKPWPIGLNADFWLNNKKLGTRMSF